MEDNGEQPADSGNQVVLRFCTDLPLQHFYHAVSRDTVYTNIEQLYSFLYNGYYYQTF